MKKLTVDSQQLTEKPKERINTEGTESTEVAERRSWRKLRVEFEGEDTGGI